LDRTGPRLLLLILAAVLASAGIAQSITALHRPPISAAQWIAPQDRFVMLSSRPRECVRPPATAEGRMLFEIGRAAFRAPLLLGGQAARGGLSCASCHSNGRRNQGFQFPGLSGDPGTADVTSSIMSSHRGNGVFDPKPIPDLAHPVKISRDPGSGALEHFIHGLIVEEFDGPEPSPQTLHAVANYVRALEGNACPLSDREPVTLAQSVDDSRRAVAAAAAAWSVGDYAAARLMVAAARSTLGLINERFASPALAADRQELGDADLELLAIEQAMDRKQPDIPLRLAAWRAAIPGWSRPLLRDERRSLFNPAELKHLLTDQPVGSG
jgi:hypothetical protein